MSGWLTDLVFDPSNPDSLDHSNNVGAYLRSSDGTLLTSTTVGSDEALDVNVVQLSGQFAEDAAHTTGDLGNFILAVANHTEGALHSADGDYAALQVDASGRLRVVADLDVTNLAEKAEDSAHGSGDIGDYVLAVRADSRPTNANTDADGDYASFFVNTNGELYVKDTDSAALLTTIDADTSSIATDASTIAGDTTSIDNTLTALSKAEDSVHSSGDQGIMSLAVRNDAGTALAADGDYIPFTTDSTGALRVTGGNDQALANTAIANAVNTVNATEESAVASALSNRKYLLMYNNSSNNTLYVGTTGVTSANGFPMPKRTGLELRAGAAVDVKVIAASAGADLRTLELS